MPKVKRGIVLNQIQSLCFCPFILVENLTNTLEYSELAYRLTQFFALLGLVSIVYFRKRLPKPFIWLAFYLVNHLVIDIIANITSKMGMNNLPLVHIYAYFEFILLSLFYRNLIKKPNFQSRFFNVFIFTGFVLMLANSLFVQTFYEYNSYAKTFGNLSIILFALIFIYNLFVDSITQTFRKAFSTINFGILIYFMGTLVIYLLSNYIFVNNTEILRDIWKITVYLNTFLMFMILFGTIQAIRSGKRQG